MPKIVATKGWNADDLLRLMKETPFDIEQDNYGNIVVYLPFHEDANGQLCSGNVDENREPTDREIYGQ